PEIRIVSLTVTEGGYFIDPATKGFDATHPDIQHDAQNPGTPKTAFGAMIAALRLRRDASIGPFTGLCCDNLQGNGAILRQTVVGLAKLSDPDLAAWIDDNCTFPNSMVDCIVPATGPDELALVQKIGIDDAVPVTHENFRQWVIEDRFCASRPPWEKVGVTFTDAVHDYESMKIRILNAGHQVLANAGELLSVPTIADCMAHPAIQALFTKVELEEIAPYVKPVADMTPSSYVELINRRFANPSIKDTTRRVAFDGSSRHPGFVLPILRDALADGGSIEGLCLVEALWARMCAGVREDGSDIEANDPFWDQLKDTAQRAKINPREWLLMDQTYGDLIDQPQVVETFTRWLNLIWQNGTAAAIGSYTGDVTN
ncbi:MAG: mannitol dehydrogenase family protein, partial [Granulosicoccus sp.]|nr:mannitol dehydrogenase family protein [Granulosicoccus sp.]